MTLLTFYCLSVNARQNSDNVQDDRKNGTFHANVIDNKFVLTDWKIAQPNALERFTIERSKDGISFETAGYVHGESSSAPEINYSFIDENPYNGISYYRVKTIQNDKQVAYSPVMSVQLSKLQFMVFPNPVQRNETVSLNIENAKSSEVVVQLFDMNGKRILNKSLQLAEGRNLLQLPVSETSAGIYTMTLSSETFFEKHMLTVK